MNRNQLPEKWQDKLKEYALTISNGKYDSLGANAFPKQKIRIEFEDKSFAVFRYAFYLLNEKEDEIAVFTEHCGYHIFYASGTVVKVLKDER